MEWSGEPFRQQVRCVELRRCNVADVPRRDDVVLVLWTDVVREDVVEEVLDQGSGLGDGNIVIKIEVCDGAGP